MNDEERAATFRRLAAERELVFDTTASPEELRFTFRLTYGDITTTRDPAKLVRLLLLARECWGEDGDFDELRAASAPLHEVLPVAIPTDIIWSLDESDPAGEGPQGIEFIAWLRYHTVLPQVGQSTDIP